MNAPYTNSINKSTKEVIILGKTVIIEDIEDNFLVAKMIPLIEKDLKENFKENVIIFKNEFYSWSVKDETLIRYEDLTEDIRQTMTTQSRVTISMRDLNNLIEKGVSLMMINSNLQDEIKRAI